MDTILRERNGVVLKAICDEEEKVTAYRVCKADDVDTYSNFYVSNDDKEVAYMNALSEYLYRAGVIDTSMRMYRDEKVKQSFIPYDKMKSIATIALKKLKSEDLLDATDLDLDDDEKEYFGIDDKVMLKTYKITRIETHYVDVAVDEDMSEYDIERKIEIYADDVSSYDWDFEEYEIEEDDCSEVSRSYAEDNCNLNLLDD